MIDFSNVIELYSKLDLNDKRNELSILLQKIDGIIDELIKKNNATNSINPAKNYNKSSDNEKNEDEILTYFYEDLINIKNKLLLLVAIDSLK